MKRPRRYKGLKDCYRLDRLLPVSQKNGKTLGFETEHFAATEDIKRGKRLRRARGKDPAALRLIRGLEGAGTPETMASARYMREERLDFAASVLEVLEPWPADQIRFFTALPVSGEIAADLLESVDARAFKERLRQQINRLSLVCYSGFLIAVLEAEFEPNGQVYRFHFHGIATGSYIAILNGLKALPSYKRRDKVKRPFRIDHVGDGDERAKVVSYLLKNHWKQRRIGPVGESGTVKRQRKSQRLNEPHHSNMLLWVDRHSVSDLSLFMGCRMRNSKIELTTDPSSADRT